MTNSSKKYAAAAGAVLLVAICITYTLSYFGKLPFTLPFMNTDIQNQNAEFARKTQEALSSHASKDYNAAITEFESLLQNNPNPDNSAATATLKEKLAVNYINRGLDQGDANDDIKKGMDMLWSLATDANLPPQIRATALTDLGTTFSLNSNEFYERYATPSPFNTYLTVKTDLMANVKASLKIFKYADSLYSNSYTKFSIVKMYMSLLVTNSIDADTTEKEVATEIQKYIADGDLELNSGTIYRDATMAKMMLERAKGLAYTGMVLNNKTPIEREEGFKLAMDTAQAANVSDKYAKDVEMEARFWYAGFLAVTFGDSRVDDIRKLTEAFKPGVTPADSFIVTRRYFVDQGKGPYTKFAQKRALLVASHSPAFKEFLLSVGWKL